MRERLDKESERERDFSSSTCMYTVQTNVYI